MRHIIPISGKDSLTTAIVQQARRPDLEYEYIYNQTGAELPEIFAWLDKVEAYLNAPILRIGADLDDIIAQQGILPSQRVRFCTRLAKIYPMEDYLKGDACTIYIGLRADEPERVGYKPSRPNQEVAYPLRDMGIGLDMVYSILDARDLTPPVFFWRALYDAVAERVEPEHIKALSRIEHNALFSWRTRPNCFYCFNQRLYEWIGLYDNHPDLYARAQALEDNTGGDGYTWMHKHPLAELIAKRDYYLQQRAKAVANMITSRRQMIMFDGVQDDALGGTACGAFCGK